MRAIRESLDKAGFNDFFINARTDTYLSGLTNALDESISRGRAYAKNGADGLFVPGISEEMDIRLVSEKVNLPLNVVALPNLGNLHKLDEQGVRRLSIGNAFSDLMIATAEADLAQLVDSKDATMLYKHDEINLNFKENGYRK